MANTTKTKSTEPAEEAVLKPAAKVENQESVYTAGELAANHKALGTPYREIVEVALRLAGKDKATLSEAKRIVERFKTKEVK